MKDNFKRIEYKKIFEMDEEKEEKPQKEVERSIIFSDNAGNLRISRPSKQLSTTVNMLDSRDFSRRRNTKYNIMGEALQSDGQNTDMSESLDFDSDSADDDHHSNEIGARNMPFLKSFVNKIWKKPKNENYNKMSQVSTYLSSNHDSTRMSYSTRRKSRRGKVKDSLSVSGTKSFTKKLSSSRKTIYLDDKNNIVNPVTKSIIQGQSMQKKRNIQNIVFEPSSSEGIWDNYSSTHGDNESIFDNSVNSPGIIKNLKYPNIIPESGTLDFNPGRNKFKGRFKSVSPIRENPTKTSYGMRQYKRNLISNNGRFFNQRRRRIKISKVKMKNKISKLMETFQSIPIKIQHRKLRQPAPKESRKK
eukprot:CAMPEP_0197010272 /NCGR_PEP_ID=MMETSP1380-20130617/53566_1 /TAXON_ID=5936 /ORGANISM="Euplotes crassus, Strain CT5" /LENGTH=359 /DNA_ID=CAMNT_0042432089 /DNA_START=724 /DNA_END=1801 /DNA_ORIENTATION=-